MRSTNLLTYLLTYGNGIFQPKNVGWIWVHKNYSPIYKFNYLYHYRRVHKVI